ncbi:hypothetical protein COU54_00615 [Candidatus Pacearchaeota archaeon CG10_big_fil_rev_8_21_14_0_10_31_24]|nr:MAG: hypothetical protein COU54_00615 [Candidatus Pacearchaeota archaeon CG10_big_fil_rev_8_21_14_0_10_31_24]
MEKEDLIQSAFLGFVISVFFKAFDFLFNYPLSLIQYQFPYSNLNFFYQFMLLLFLVTIVFFILGDNPQIIRLKDEELIQYFKKISWWCLGILMVTIIFLGIINSYWQGRLFPNT